jgi:hypothetical protein
MDHTLPSRVDRYRLALVLAAMYAADVIVIKATPHRAA